MSESLDSYQEVYLVAHGIKIGEIRENYTKRYLYHDISGIFVLPATTLKNCLIRVGKPRSTPYFFSSV